MITKQEAMNLRHGDILHHMEAKNADKTPLRIRVAGKCITWKTRPEEFRLPCKYGMYQTLDVNQINAHQWEVAK